MCFQALQSVTVSVTKCDMSQNRKFEDEIEKPQIAFIISLNLNFVILHQNR